MQKDIVVCLFDTSGVMGEPWRAAGYRVIRLDIFNNAEFRIPESGESLAVNADLLHGVPDEMMRPEFLERVAFVAAFPPCTHMAVSGARWFKGKGLRKLADSIHMFATAAEFCEASGAPYLIENPVSTISTYWRQPDHTFHPWHFNRLDADSSYTKKTCLWVGNGFRMPLPLVDESLLVNKNYIHYLGSDAKDDSGKDLRSVTPAGFARAVFLANAAKN